MDLSELLKRRYFSKNSFLLPYRHIFAHSFISSCRRESLAQKRSGEFKTEYLKDPAPDEKPALRIAYFIYEKNAKERKWTKFVERLAPHFSLVQLDATEIANSDALEQGNFDVLFVGGGMPAEHAMHLDGQKVRSWLQNRTDRLFVGTCAGAYVACARQECLIEFNPSWSLLGDVEIDMTDHETCQEFQWQHGLGESLVQWTECGKQLLVEPEPGTQDAPCSMMYQNGPLLRLVQKSTVSEEPFYKSVSLGTFANVVQTKKKQNKAMLGAAAVVLGRCDNNVNNGYVLIFSAHPEFSSFSLVPMLQRAFSLGKQTNSDTIH